MSNATAKSEGDGDGDGTSRDDANVPRERNEFAQVRVAPLQVDGRADRNDECDVEHGVEFPIERETQRAKQEGEPYAGANRKHQPVSPGVHDPIQVWRFIRLHELAEWHQGVNCGLSISAQDTQDGHDAEDRRQRELQRQFPAYALTQRHEKDLETLQEEKQDDALGLKVQEEDSENDDEVPPTSHSALSSEAPIAPLTPSGSLHSQQPQQQHESHVKDTVVQVLHQDTTDDSDDPSSGSIRKDATSTPRQAPRNKRTASSVKLFNSSDHILRTGSSATEIPRVELKHRPSTIQSLASSQHLAPKKTAATTTTTSDSEADEHSSGREEEEEEEDSSSERDSYPMRRRGGLTDDEEDAHMARDGHDDETGNRAEPGFFDSMRISIDGTRLHLQREFPHHHGYDTESAMTDSEVDTEMETDMETDLESSRQEDDMSSPHHHRDTTDSKKEEMKLSRKLHQLRMKSMSVMRRHGAFLFGLAFVQIGCLLFNWGIVYGLSPLSLQVGSWLPTAYMHVNGISSSPKFQYGVGVLLVLVFGFLLGALVTLAEPGMAVFCRQVSSLTNGEVDTTFLLSTVSVGVGGGLAIGLLTLVFHIPTLYIVLGGYPIAVLFTIFTPNVGLSAVAWDAAGTVTGPVTTPLVLSIGLAFGLKDPIVDGFGVLTCAAIFPIVSILATKMTIDIFSGLKAQARASPVKPGQMGVLSATLLWEDGEIDLDGKRRYHHHHKRRKRRHRRRRRDNDAASASSDDDHQLHLHQDVTDH